jgi:chitinase
MNKSTQLVFSLLASIMAHTVTAQNVILQDGFERGWVSGYYVGYERNLHPVSELDLSAITHLMVGRAVPNANGSLTTTFDIDAVGGPQWAMQVTTAVHAQNRKAILMIGGAGEYAGFVGAASAANRATFVTNLLTTMDNLGFDGLDLDWEPINTSDQPNLLALAQALRAARPNMLLTIPIGWVNANFATPDPFYGQLSASFNQVNAMTYDMAGAWSGWQSWHSSALQGHSANTPSSVSSTVNFFLNSGVPARKLGMGLPFYGTCWRGVTGPRQTGGSVQASDGAMSYKNIVETYYTAANYQWDAAASTGFLGSATGMGAQLCNFLSYENPQSIAAKGAYVKQAGLGGVIIWTIAQGHFPALPAGQRDPLLQAIRDSF